MVKSVKYKDMLKDAMEILSKENVLDGIKYHVSKGDKYSVDRISQYLSKRYQFLSEEWVMKSNKISVFAHTNGFRGIDETIEFRLPPSKSFVPPRYSGLRFMGWYDESGSRIKGDIHPKDSMHIFARWINILPWLRNNKLNELFD